MDLAPTISFTWTQGASSPALILQNVDSGGYVYTPALAGNNADQLGLFVVPTSSSSTSVYIRIQWGFLAEGSIDIPDANFVEESVEAFVGIGGQGAGYQLYAKTYIVPLSTGSNRTIWVPMAAHFCKIACGVQGTPGAGDTVKIYVEFASTGSPSLQGR